MTLVKTYNFIFKHVYILAWRLNDYLNFQLIVKFFPPSNLRLYVFLVKLCFVQVRTEMVKEEFAEEINYRRLSN